MRANISKHEIEQMARLWLHSAEIQHQREAIADGATTAEQREQARVDLANESGALRSLDTNDDHDGLIMVARVMLMAESERVALVLNPVHALVTQIGAQTGRTMIRFSMADFVSRKAAKLLQWLARIVESHEPDQLLFESQIQLGALKL